jgi:hypothetical protein
MVDISRHILSIVMFILLPEHCCLTNKTCKEGFRYENFVFLAENSLEVLFYYYDEQ